MTTIVGMRHPNSDLAILVADRQGTIHRDGLPVEKNLTNRKLWISDDQTYAFGIAGGFDESVSELAGKMKDGSIDLAKVISEGTFPELQKLNYAQMGTKIPDPSVMTSFLLISREGDKSNLYTCFPLGDVEERGVTWVGSGSSRVEKYFAALNVISEAKSYLGNSGSYTHADMIEVGLEAVNLAQAGDIYSSGLDMVAMEPKGAMDHFDLLQDNFAHKIEKIKKLYPANQSTALVRDNSSITR